MSSEHEFQNEKSTSPSPELRPLSAGTIKVKWSVVALITSLIALVSVGSLIVVASIHGSDGLSTIALALAILSFLIQIGLFAGDSWYRTQTELRAGKVNADTQSLLAEMKATSRATNDLVNRQFDTVLKHLVDTAERTVGNFKGRDPEKLRARLDTELRNVLSGRPTEEKLPSAENQAIIDEYRTPLTEEQMNLAKKLTQKISPAAVAEVARFGEDDRTARRQLSPPGLFESLVRNTEELKKGGIIAEAPRPPGFEIDFENEKFYILTPNGRVAARYLLS